MDIERNREERTIGLQVSSHAELLASIPITLGSTVSEGYLALLFEQLEGEYDPITGDPRFKSAAVATVDLTSPSGFLANMVLKAPCYGALLVCYSTRPLDDEDTHEFMRHEAMHIIEGGKKVLNAFHVTPEGWWSYPDQTGGPASDLLNVVLDNHEELHDVVPTQDLRGDFEPIKTDRRLVVALATQTLDVVSRPANGPTPWSKEETTDIFERLITDGVDNMSDEDIAKALISLELPGLRDLCLMQWGSSIETAREIWDSHFNPDDGEQPEHSIVRGIGMRLERDRLEAGTLAGRALAGITHGSSWLIAPMFLGAWCAWAHGNSIRAHAMMEIVIAAYNHQLEQGKHIEHHQIVLGFMEAIRHGAQPEWLYDRDI